MRQCVSLVRGPLATTLKSIFCFDAALVNSMCLFATTLIQLCVVYPLSCSRNSSSFIPEATLTTTREDHNDLAGPKPKDGEEQGKRASKRKASQLVPPWSVPPVATDNVMKPPTFIAKTRQDQVQRHCQRAQCCPVHQPWQPRCGQHVQLLMTPPPAP